eukprot:m51a1_g883 hypothetical protein (456) ;mRNA; f:888592-890308
MRGLGLVVAALAVLCAALTAPGRTGRLPFGTKTPYPEAAGDAALPTPPGGCEPVYLDLVCRHGSRYPTSSTLGAIRGLEDLLALARPAGGRRRRGAVARVGGVVEVPLRGIGRRFAERFPSLLSSAAYSPNLVSIRSTYKPRTAQSALAFAEGALGAQRDVPVAVVSESKKLDRELRFFDHCPRWEAEVHRSGEALAQSEQYRAAVAPAIARRIAATLSVPEANVTVGAVRAMWEACQYDYVVGGELGRWCALFDDANAAELHFADDLATYVRRGYGRNLSVAIVQPLVNSVLEGMDSALLGADVTSTDYLAARLRFAHAETVMPLVAALGLLRDAEPLSSSWTAEQRAHRKWRGSHVAPFSANVAFVLYNCSGDAAEPLVLVLHNEDAVVLPGCSSEYCPLSQVQVVVVAEMPEEEAKQGGKDKRKDKAKQKDQKHKKDKKKRKRKTDKDDTDD